jgi:hypothetical protein
MSSIAILLAIGALQDLSLESVGGRSGAAECSVRNNLALAELRS